MLETPVVPDVVEETVDNVAEVAEVNTPESQEAIDRAAVEGFKSRSMLTQTVNQAILQAASRQKGTGISVTTAELVHSLASAISAIVSDNVEERYAGWAAIANTASLAMALERVGVADAKQAEEAQ